MFDAPNSRKGPGGFLSTLRESQPLSVETLEGREVPAVISGCVYADMNGNGIQDAGEVGIANSTVQLYNASGALVATTVSDSMGMYQFTRNGGPTPGPGEKSYELAFDQAKTNHTRTGTLPRFDSSLGTLTSVEIIAEGAIQSKVIVENLDTEAADIEAELKGSLKFTVNGRTISATPTRTLTASVDEFDGQADMDGSSAHDFGTTQLTGSFQTITLTNTSDLSSFIGSGTFSISEVAKMQSCICGPGNLMGAVSSVAQGKVKVVYHYQPGNDLGPGNYRIVQATQPAGFIDGYDTRGGVVPLPNSNRTDFITVGVVNRTDVLTNNCFGEIRPSNLSGTVYHDVNKSNALNAGDVGLANVLVTLTGVDIFGVSVSRQTYTNSSGFYAFNNLTAGRYTIRETQPAGYTQGTNTAGSKGGTVVGDTITMQLAQATNAINYNFGEILNTTPSDPIVTSPGGKGNFVHIVGFPKGWTW